MKNPHAAALGRMAAGRPKKYSAEEIRKRTERLAAANAVRLKKIQERKAQNEN